MAIHVALHHCTHYVYDRLVGHAPHVIRLRPAPHCRTRILSYSLKILPAGHFLNWQQDPFANWNARVVFPDKSREMRVEVDLVAEMSVLNPFDFFLEDSATHFPFVYEAGLLKDLAPFRERLPAGPLMAAFLGRIRREMLRTPGEGVVDHAPVPESERPVDVHHDGGVLPAAGLLAGGTGTEPPRTMDFLVALNRRVSEAVRYLIRMEPGVQDPEETLGFGSGSCRDSAWLLCQVLRHLGLAARFASGYLIQLRPDVKPLDGPGGTEADFTDLHAWCEVYLPGAGWIGLDPTSGLLAGEGHLPLSCTPDPGSAAPVTGAVEPCEARMEHSMRVTRILETPRVTLPYSEEQWEEIDRLGERVDAELARGDVRLSMGGEPTFVSVDDPDGEEWNTVAQGPAKRVLADRLLRRLRERFAPGGLLFHGQGKWYPGEVLPRWALACYWRHDGEPAWSDPTLFADESVDAGHGVVEAERFARALAARLGVDGRWLMPAREDVYYHLWRERRLPVNVDPLRSRLDDPGERARLRRVFGQGLGTVVGQVLPLQRAVHDGRPGWSSGPWFLRDGTLWLIPGDSPIGYRLPLDSQPWAAAGDRSFVPEVDPTAPASSLPPREALLRRQASVRGAMPAVGPGPEGAGGGTGTDGRANLRAPAPGESASGIVRTALCVEPRSGRLHVFFPPLPSAADFLELAGAVEATARELGLPVLLEGNPPPFDPGLAVFKVTPDPGVIEVNLHPSRTWGELVERTTVLYDEARATRLGTEKFLLDGRQAGTGGGNHVVLGGATPSDSPFLRRPDLLRSLLACWHNHPSLSYLFSGLFIGPTSQHPRIDEARHDALYELETAFRQVPDRGWVPPWLVDRIFRHLLVDVTGNTHRTEFCIDKLYSPDGPGGRLGLVELRSFEMPPHARMSLVQQLLLRAMVTRFWREPYRHSLVRWGTVLHDRFMLPHFVWDDFRDVLAGLGSAGFPLRDEWFAPHFEFRFPRLGGFSARGVDVEVRQALEPWHVLGEEPAGGGSVRFVDSSLERIQVRARGLVGGRHVVACNGRRVPLHPTGTAGEFVAGVRYRAWQPPSCLQPTIGVHAPLVIDLLDTWNGRSVGGCTYHVAHPGGRNHTTFPVNAYEAESRRLARFFEHGHSPGPRAIPGGEVQPEFPLTLDLRR